jgi:membrane-associated phospholipid phosphatase
MPPGRGQPDGGSGACWGVLAIVLAACNALARIYLGAHNPLDVVGGAAIGLMIAAVLDLILDVARVLPQLDAPAREDRAT